jgi:hypothetical protein
VRDGERRPLSEGVRKRGNSTHTPPSYVSVNSWYEFTMEPALEMGPEMGLWNEKNEIWD